MIETSKGPARFLEYPAKRARVTLVLGHGAGGGVYRDLPGHKHHIAQIQCLTVRADGGRCVRTLYDRSAHG